MIILIILLIMFVCVYIGSILRKHIDNNITKEQWYIFDSALLELHENRSNINNSVFENMKKEEYSINLP